MAKKARSVTLKDVAKAADVHVSTASRALDPPKALRISPETVARVQLAAEQLGYMPDMIAKGLKRGTTTMIGVIVADLGNPFIGPVIRGILEKVETQNFVTLVAETLEDHDRFERTLNHLLSRRVNAVITTAARTSDRHMLKRFAERVPVVLAVRDVSDSGLPSVTQGDYHGAVLAAEDLAGLGHQVTAQLRGPGDIEIFVNRAEGFRHGAGSHGVLDVTVADSAKELTVAEGRRLMALTLDQNEERSPTAVFAHADVMAIGAIEEIKARGLRCPDDISVVGYDDVPLAGHVDPPLSTVKLPGTKLGRAAGEMAMKLIEDPNADPKKLSVSLPATWIPRASTAAPPTKNGSKGGRARRTKG